MLHYNENSGRAQAETNTGEKRYSILYSEYKFGGLIYCQENYQDLYLHVW